MKKMLQHICTFFLVCYTCQLYAQDIIPAKYAAIVVDYKTGEVLYAKNANDIRYPASLTKMMTLFLVFEAIDHGILSLDQPLTVSQHAAKQKPSKLGLRPGQTITVRNAILALVTKSANDVAAVIAESLAGSEEKFSRMMTAQARELGMRNTYFYNASGLPHDRQRTTAADMARLSIALLHYFPHYYHYFKTQNFSYKKHKYRNHNRLLGEASGVDGIKTGYIRASGFNLAASAVRKGKRIIAVVMGGKTAKSRNHHMQQLLDRGFSRAGIFP
jgi:D-alanyl-D-alanine carboxypeptidase